MFEFPDRLTLLDHLPHGGIVAEIGVQRGDFAAEILRRCRPRLLVLIDSWRHFSEGAYVLDKSNVSQSSHEAFYKEVCQRFRVEVLMGKAIVLRGLSDDLIPMLADGWLDWIYVDADHSYDAIRRNLADAMLKIKPDGLICGHDFVESSEQGFGVVQGVTDFCETSGWEMIARTRNDRSCDGYDSYVLRRRQSSSLRTAADADGALTSPERGDLRAYAPAGQSSMSPDSVATTRILTGGSQLPT